MSIYKSFKVKDRKRKHLENARGNDCVPLDLSQHPESLLTEIFQSLCSQNPVSTGRKLGHLNNFIKILCHVEDFTEYFSMEEIMVCLKPALVSDVKEVRAACIRALRYLINDSYSVSLLTKLHLDCLIIKCLDISHFNEVERIHCLRLIRKIIHVLKTEEDSKAQRICTIPKAFVSCIISISCDGGEERDRVYRTCLAVLCELVILEPAIVIQCGGLLVLFKAILECHMYKRVNESLCMSLILLLNHPNTRQLTNFELTFDPLFGPYTDITYWQQKDAEESLFFKEEKEIKYVASKMAIVAVLRTWTGLLHLARSASLKSFLSTLEVQNSTTKQATLSVLYEIFCIPEPKWTSEFSEALQSLTTDSFQDSWRLSNLFIAAEGKVCLPMNSNSRPDLINCYMSVLLSVFIRDNLIQHLVNVVLSPDPHAATSAAILLGGILRLANKLLPNFSDLKGDDEFETDSDIQKHYQHTAFSTIYRECLPELMRKATSRNSDIQERLLAGITINRLQEAHNFFHKPAAPFSIYLTELLFRVNNYKLNREKMEQYPTSASFSRSGSQDSISKESSTDENSFSLSSSLSMVRRSRSLTIVRDFLDDQLTAKIKETQVLALKDFTSWKWDAVSSLFLDSWHRNTPSLRGLKFVGYNDTVQRFIKRLINHFMPNTGPFCKLDNARDRFDDPNRPMIQAGCHLVRFLTNADDDGIKLLNMLVQNIVLYIMNLIKDGDGTMKVNSKLLSTCSRDYFLMLGALSSVGRGAEMLEQHKISHLLNSLSNASTHENLIKLVVSSLFYTSESSSQYFLKKVLVSCNEASRMYATSYMRVLIRAKVPDFVSWGISLLITQLYDTSSSIAMEALNIMNEACDEYEYLDAIVKLRPSVLHLREPGALLICRFMSHPLGFDSLSENKYLTREINRWWDTVNERYVLQVEELLKISLSSFEKSSDHGEFVRRSGTKKKVCPVHLPSHMYGELCQHDKGICVIEEEKIVPRLVKKLDEEVELHENYCSDSNDQTVTFTTFKTISEHLTSIKATLWALGHIGSSTQGLDLLRPYGIVKRLKMLVETSRIESIRSTCLFCLSIISQTVCGAEELKELGWLSVSNKMVEWFGESSAFIPSYTKTSTPSPKNPNGDSKSSSKETSPVKSDEGQNLDETLQDNITKGLNISFQDSCTFNSLRERLDRRKRSLKCDFRQLSLSDSSANPVPAEVSREINRTTHFVGIALPRDLNILFKCKQVKPVSDVSIAFLPHRHRAKQFSSMKLNFFTTSSPDEYTSSDENTLIDTIASAAENQNDMIQQDILRMVTSLGSSVGVKMNETGLLLLKEKFPEMFNSLELYYTVSEMLAQYNFRITSRRFIQELFHDVAFNEVFEEASNTLNKCCN